MPYDASERIAELDSILAELSYTIDMMGKHRHIKRDIVQNFSGFRLYMTEDEWNAYAEGGGGSGSRYLQPGQSY